jgi:23S rRNA pseudouridine1911/1915/1917 synthase
VTAVAAAATAATNSASLRVVAEDDELLVVDKPAGLVCHPGKQGPLSCLVGRVRHYLGANAHLVNRLDRETGGLVLVAKSADTARELGRLLAARQIDKEYLALVHGDVTPVAGVIDAPLGKDDSSRVAIRDGVRPDGRPARTHYLRLVAGSLATPTGTRLVNLLRIRPESGRKHQIRIHLAHLGHPIVGDKIYGGCEDDYLALVEGRLGAAARARLILEHHALHASGLAFAWRGVRRDFRSEPDWAAWGIPDQPVLTTAAV